MAVTPYGANRRRRDPAALPPCVCDQSTPPTTPKGPRRAIRFARSALEGWQRKDDKTACGKRPVVRQGRPKPNGRRDRRRPRPGRARRTSPGVAARPSASNDRGEEIDPPGDRPIMKAVAPRRLERTQHILSQGFALAQANPPSCPAGARSSGSAWGRPPSGRITLARASRGVGVVCHAGSRRQAE